MQGESRVGAGAMAGVLARQRAAMLALLLAVAVLAGVSQVAQAQRATPPTVSLSAATRILKPGDSTTLTATATARGSTIARVVFYDNGSQLGVVAAAPFTLKFTPSTQGVHNITAIAVDSRLAQATSNTVSINVTATGNAPPTVSLSAASTHVYAGGSTVLTAAPGDSDGAVTRITFMSNGVSLGSVTGSPWQLTFVPSSVGTYSITAVATDNAGASTTSNPVAITVTSTGRNAVAPSVSLSSSATTVAVGSTATLTAAASDSDGSVTRVEFYNGFSLVGTDTTSPYSYSFTPTSAGTFTLTAKAYDNIGLSTVSNAITITVTGVTVPPSAALPRITLALSNTLLAPGGSVNLTGTAAATAPRANVSRVSFYVNGELLATDTTTPYQATSTFANPGAYDVHATVVDSLGQTQSTLVQRVTVQNAPPVATTSADVWRLLNQATFGASQAEAARVTTMGVAGWIDDQIGKPVSGYPESRYNRIQLGATPDCTTQMPDTTAYPPDSPQARCARDHLSLAMVQRDFFTNAVYGSDQLRQRVAWALSQILVTSANEGDLSYAYVMSRYQNLMFEEAFGNYESLLRKITYSPAMGNYLDMVNNDRAPQQPTTSTRVPNENYAREIMQLFSINLIELNDDGTPLLDAQGKPIPTYGQGEIAEFAKVFTGYTYASADGAPATGKRGARYYAAPMVPYPTTSTTGHEPGEKHLLNGTTLPAGQTAQQDIDAAVRNVFMHANTPVYISKQLIQRLVTGNPSPAYVRRIVQVFKNNGAGVRGDMAAVVKAILLDTEARGPAKTASDFGSLREPVLMVTGMVRALNGVTDGNRLEQATGNLGQRPYYSPTVFNYFMPDVKVPGTSILGPEFGIHTTVSAVGRANLVYTLTYGGYNPDTTIPGATGTKLFLAPFEAIADQPAAMVSLVNQTLAGGQFPASLEPTIVTAVSAITMSATPTAQQRTDRARMAVYLMASSYDYQVQR